MIQTVCFDFGGVLLHSVQTETLLAWEMRLDIPPGQTERTIYGGAIGEQVQRGDITDDTVWALAADKFALSAEETLAFRNAVTSSYRLDKELIAWIYHLRQHYQIALISNAPDGLRQALHTIFPIADAFDLIVCSAEEGLLKPDPEIYRRTLTRLQCAPEAALLIDDRMENIQSARSIGMEGIQFRDYKELRQYWADYCLLN